jgi:Rieske Fe-S protein
VTDRLTDEPLSRRTLAGLAAAAGLSLPVLSACSGDESAPDDLGSPADIKVGGGTVFADAGVVVTQPTAGDFKAFDATCTHQGCQVGDVTDRLIHCPCHNSKFSIEDGSPQSGPATSPLKEVTITVTSDEIKLA